MNRALIHIRPQPSPRPRFGGNVTYMSKKYTQYKRFIGDMCRNFDKHDGAVMVELEFGFKPSKSHKRNKYQMPRPDADNCAKSILDSLEGISYENDTQVVELHIKKLYADDDYVLINIQEVK